MKKETWKNIRQAAAVACMTLILLATCFELVTHVAAQGVGYRYGPNGIVYQGQNSGDCFEPTVNSGPDVCIQRMTTGQVGITQGGINIGNAYLPAAPVIALATATTGGTIPAGTYRLAFTYMTINGGETTIAAAQEATQATTGSTSTITATAPLAAAGAAGYRVYSSAISGASLSELSQPITTTVCAGAFQVNGPTGPGTGPWVCPFGVNAVLTSITITAATASTPNIPGTVAVINGGLAIPSLNTAAYPAAIPETICNLLPQTARTTITTIQPMGSCILSAGIQNSVGKILHITGHGIYTSSAQTGTMTISLTEGGITPMTVTSAAIVTGGQTNAQFTFDYILTTSLTGTSGTLEGHGTLAVNLATAANGNILSVYEDQITAASSAIDLTAANTLVANITMTSSTTSAQLRDMQVVAMN